MPLSALERAERYRESLLYFSEDKKTISIDKAIEQVITHFEQAFEKGVSHARFLQSEQCRAKKEKRRAKQQQQEQKKPLVRLNHPMGFRSISVRAMLKRES